MPVRSEVLVIARVILLDCLDPLTPLDDLEQLTTALSLNGLNEKYGLPNKQPNDLEEFSHNVQSIGPGNWRQIGQTRAISKIAWATI